MKNQKLKIGIVFGGKSPEHNISLLSASNVIENVDKDLFEVVLLPIDRNGVWHYDRGPLQLNNRGNAQSVSLPDYDNVVILSQNTGDGAIIDKLPISTSSKKIKTALLAANQKFAKSEKRKVYSQHVVQGRRKGIYFENEIPYGEDRDGDGKIDKQKRRRK